MFGRRLFPARWFAPRWFPSGAAAADAPRPESTVTIVGKLDRPPMQGLVVAVGQAKTFTVLMNTPPAGGVAGWTMRFRLYAPDGTLVVTLTAADDAVALVDEEAGEWTVSLTTDDTTRDPGTYAWDFGRTDAGLTTPVAHGSLELYLGVGVW